MPETGEARSGGESTGVYPMKTEELRGSIDESMGKAFKTKRVFGKAYDFDGLSVIPVARVKMAAGGGGGEEEREGEPGGSGGGMGFIGGARPVGYIKVRKGRARFVPIWGARDRMLLALMAFAVAAGLALMSRRGHPAGD